MKKLKLLFTILIGLTILSCSSDDDNNQTPDNTSKLIKKVTLSNQNQTYSVNFSYNSDNSIDKLEYLDTGGDFIEQYFYNNGELDRIERQDLNGVTEGSSEVYSYENGQPVEQKDYINITTLDEVFKYFYNNNLLSSIQYFGFNETEYSKQDIYQYDSNQNVISILTDYVNASISEEETVFTYDSKNNPFKNIEPKITLKESFISFNNNLVTEVKTNLSKNTSISTKNYTYSYDNDEYPISRTDGNETLTFEYFE